MIDGNISMEEDTELRDLVIQTLENNGVLAKIRAELRASVFLTLEEQESVLNPEPLLNKPVRQYLSKPEGKVLFALVREFLEYFGLDYTLSIFDTETYLGKEYDYNGRKQLGEDLGISTSEPLLGEILKNTINAAVNNIEKNNSSQVNLDNSNQNVDNHGNSTFDISNPKVLHKDSDVSNDSSKINDFQTKNNPEEITANKVENLLNHSSIDQMTDHKIVNEKLNNTSNLALKEKSALINNSNENTNNKHLLDQLSFDNLKNKKINEPIVRGKTLYFDEIIVDGTSEKVTEKKDVESFVGQSSNTPYSNTSNLGDLPPLNGKKTHMNDLKELMDIAKSVSQYDEDLPSSGSSPSEQSPSKIPVDSNKQFISPKALNESAHNSLSDNSEEIHEELSSGTSYIDNLLELQPKDLDKVHINNE
ncbi:hypothetical protein TKK_0006821 [Trichogramma kaykai]|uniref:FGFR1 oncogene partner (FOP) N-terminal dimerisation domain-containing protein n=1 Tax=Trichogramma kaykai TaxID=54128 RepID=A0ABD2XD36_9HYME